MFNQYYIRATTKRQRATTKRQRQKAKGKDYLVSVERRQVERCDAGLPGGAEQLAAAELEQVLDGRGVAGGGGVVQGVVAELVDHGGGGTVGDKVLHTPALDRRHNINGVKTRDTDMKKSAIQF